MVVDADADLDQAVPAIVASAFGYAGQKCSAAARLIVLGPIYHELVDRLLDAAAAVPVGHARELGTVVGPLIDEDAWQRVARYRALARAEGEVLVFSRSPTRIGRAVAMLRAGNVYVNPRHHGCARPPPAVRRLRPLRRRLESGRAGLPPPVR